MLKSMCERMVQANQACHSCANMRTSQRYRMDDADAAKLPMGIQVIEPFQSGLAFREDHMS